MDRLPINDDFSLDSKVWIFVAERKLLPKEVAAIEERLAGFSTSWSSHNNQLKSHAFVMFGHFIVLIADETQAPASGCSIDTAMRFLQTLQIDFEVDFLQTDRFVFMTDPNEFKLVDKEGLKAAIDRGEVKEDTMFFDTLVNNLRELKTNWLKPRHSFWVSRIGR